MKKEEIKEFIEHMELLGDRWTEIQVEDVYGSNTLEEALNDRKVHLNEFMNLLLVRSRASLMVSQVSKVSSIAQTRPFLYIFPVLTVLLGIIAGPK